MPSQERLSAAVDYDRGKQRCLGSFGTAQQAHAAYCEAAAQQFGAFARFS